MSKIIGLAFDNFSGNTGDVAIGLSLKNLLDTYGKNYRELFPGSRYERYHPIIVGGGHLLRESSMERVYQQFKIPGQHILNAMGIHGRPTDLEYLNEYRYVSVRSNGDREKIKYVTNAHVVPCTTLLLKDQASNSIKINERSIGIHIYSDVLSKESTKQLIDWCQVKIKQGYSIYFLPITHHREDHSLFVPLVQKIGVPCHLLPVLNPLQIFTLIGQFTQMISFSLHGAMFAYIHNVPFYLFNDIEKNVFFLHDRGLSACGFASIHELILKFTDENKMDYSNLIIQDLNTLSEHTYIIKSLL